MSVFVFLTTFAVALFTANTTYAVCPVCTFTIAGGLGISRWLGIDDTIPSLWIGGLVLSMGFWLSDWLKGKNFNIRYGDFLSVSFLYLLTLSILCLTNVLFLPGNTLWGQDKILIGMFFGSIGFYSATLIDKYIRKTNDNQVLFYYQKVILPVSLLSVLSLIFYLII